MAGDPDQLTVPVYPVPAVVVVTGVAPVIGAVTPAIAGVEITISATGAEVGAVFGSWIGFGFPQSAGRLDNISSKLHTDEYLTTFELIIFPLFVLAETEKL